MSLSAVEEIQWAKDILERQWCANPIRQVPKYIIEAREHLIKALTWLETSHEAG